MKLFDWTYKLTRWCLGGIFITVGIIKMLEPNAFAVLIEAYGIVPESLLLPLSITIPALEVAAGIGMLFDIEGSLSVITGIPVVFSLGKGQSIQ